jgi:hypothetical protein
MGRELREAEDGFLRSDKSTSGVDGHISVQSSQRVRERVIGRRGRQGAGCEPLAGIWPESFGAKTYHCKRLRLGYPALFHSCKSIDNIVRVGEVTCYVQLIVRAVCFPQ